MDERVMQFRVGVMFLATLVVVAVLVMLFGHAPGLIHGSYTVRLVVPQAAGVSEGTPVRKRGVLIGRVVGRPKLIDDGVELVLRIDGDRKIESHEVPRINYSPFGDARIDFEPATERGKGT